MRKGGGEGVGGWVGYFQKFRIGVCHLGWHTQGDLGSPWPYLRKRQTKIETLFQVQTQINPARGTLPKDQKAKPSSVPLRLIISKPNPHSMENTCIEVPQPSPWMFKQQRKGGLQVQPLVFVILFWYLLQPLLLCRERWFDKRKTEDIVIKGFINSHFAILSVKRIF